MAPSLSIAGMGMVTGVGLGAASSAAAIRCGINNFRESAFMDDAGEWIQTCEVPLDEPWRGVPKLAKMLASAIQECLLRSGRLSLHEIPVVLCFSEPSRPGRPGDLPATVLRLLENEMRCKLHPESQVVEHGRVGAAIALLTARQVIASGRASRVLIAAADSLLDADTIRVFEHSQRILTSENSNGFIPGEAAAAVLVEGGRETPHAALRCLGIGLGTEQATIDSTAPLRADGLVEALKNALADGQLAMTDVDFRIVDVSGEQYWFKESSLALLRTLHKPKPEFDLWHPADCIGEVGAAIGVVNLILAAIACQKGYAKGNTILCHFSNDNNKRAAFILRYGEGTV